MRQFVFLCLFTVCFCFLTAACGLDVVSVVLEDNVSVENKPNEETSPDNQVFKFSTRKLSNSNSLGKTYIYYKIYNYKSTMESEENTLNNMIGDTNRKYNSATTLLNNYNYRQLHMTPIDGNKDNSTGVEFDNASYNIRIRLNNYIPEIEEYSAGVWIDNKKAGIPVRIVNSNSFDFNGTGNNDAVPKINEDDTKSFRETQTEQDKGYYYVVLYSVFMMLDDSYTPVYSPVSHLGHVKIESN